LIWLPIFWRNVTGWQNWLSSKMCSRGQLPFNLGNPELTFRIPGNPGIQAYSILCNFSLNNFSLELKGVQNMCCHQGYKFQWTWGRIRNTLFTSYFTNGSKKLECFITVDVNDLSVTNISLSDLFIIHEKRSVMNKVSVACSIQHFTTIIDIVS
jgi:hypothetical protein